MVGVLNFRFSRGRGGGEFANKKLLGDFARRMIRLVTVLDIMHNFTE